MNTTTERRLIYVCIAMMIFNLLVSFVIYKTGNSGAYHLDGSYVAPKSIELIRASLIAQFLSIPLISSLLGAITTIFIDKHRPYRKRYLKGFLFTLTALYGVFFLMGVVKLVTISYFIV